MGGVRPITKDLEHFIRFCFVEFNLRIFIFGPNVQEGVGGLGCAKNVGAFWLLDKKKKKTI